MLKSLPPPGPGTVRRTVSLFVTPEPTWVDGLRITASARDLRVDTDGEGRVLGSRGLTVALDAQSRITALSGDLPASMAESLIGVSPVRGFRARLAELPGLDPSSLDSALLDDLPTVRLVSGYAMMMEMPDLLNKAGRRSPLIGVCAGWAPDATADRRAQAGVPLLSSAPAAPALATMTARPGDFHQEPASRPRSMRRRRILDVTAGADGYDVFEYFRDSYFDPASREGSLHEYVVRAKISADGSTVEDIDVTPEALPFPECPLASPNARDLVGTSLGEVTGTVKSRLSGTRGCTHLNDVLRFLRYVPTLTPA